MFTKTQLVAAVAVAASISVNAAPGYLEARSKKTSELPPADAGIAAHLAQANALAAHPAPPTMVHPGGHHHVVAALNAHIGGHGHAAGHVAPPNSPQRRSIEFLGRRMHNGLNQNPPAGPPPPAVQHLGGVNLPHGHQPAPPTMMHAGAHNHVVASLQAHAHGAHQGGHHPGDVPPTGSPQRRSMQYLNRRMHHVGGGGAPPPAAHPPAPVNQNVATAAGHNLAVAPLNAHRATLAQHGQNAVVLGAHQVPGLHEQHSTAPPSSPRELLEDMYGEILRRAVAYFEEMDELD